MINTGNIRIDIPFIPKAEVTNHRVNTYQCLDCGQETVPEAGLIKGTSREPNLLKMVVGFCKMCANYHGIVDLFSGLFGIDRYSKSTIRHAPDAVADQVCAEVDKITAQMTTKKYPMGMDETPMPVTSGTGQVWLTTDEDAAPVMVAGSLGRTVLREHFSFFQRPLTANDPHLDRNLFGTL